MSARSHLSPRERSELRAMLIGGVSANTVAAIFGLSPSRVRMLRIEWKIAKPQPFVVRPADPATIERMRILARAYEAGRAAFMLGHDCRSLYYGDVGVMWALGWRGARDDAAVDARRLKVAA